MIYLSYFFIFSTSIFLAQTSLANEIISKSAFKYSNTTLLSLSASNAFSPYIAEIFSGSKYTTINGTVYSVSTLKSAGKITSNTLNTPTITETTAVSSIYNKNFTASSSTFNSSAWSTNFKNSLNFSASASLNLTRKQTIPQVTGESSLLPAPSSSVSSYSDYNLTLKSNTKISDTSNLVSTSKKTVTYLAVPEIIDKTITVNTSKIVTITSCSHNACETKKLYTLANTNDISQTRVSSFILSTSITTVEGSVTEYVTWCPLSSKTDFSVISSSDNKVNLTNVSKTSDSSQITSTLSFKGTANIITTSSNNLNNVKTLGSSTGLLSKSTSLEILTKNSNIISKSLAFSQEIFAEQSSKDVTQMASKNSINSSTEQTITSTNDIPKVIDKTISIDVTKIATITSCLHDACETNQYYVVSTTSDTKNIVSTYILSTSTDTIENVVTEYTTWCPLTQSNSATKTLMTVSTISDKVKLSLAFSSNIISTRTLSTSIKSSVLAATTILKSFSSSSKLLPSYETLSSYSDNKVGSSLSEIVSVNSDLTKSSKISLLTKNSIKASTTYISTVVTSLFSSDMSTVKSIISTYLPVQVSIFTTTLHGVVTEYTTYCPLTASSSLESYDNFKTPNYLSTVSITTKNQNIDTHSTNAISIKTSSTSKNLISKSSSITHSPSIKSHATNTVNLQSTSTKNTIDIDSGLSKTSNETPSSKKSNFIAVTTSIQSSSSKNLEIVSADSSIALETLSTLAPTQQLTSQIQSTINSYTSINDASTQIPTLTTETSMTKTASSLTDQLTTSITKTVLPSSIGSGETLSYITSIFYVSSTITQVPSSQSSNDFSSFATIKSTPYTTLQTSSKLLISTISLYTGGASCFVIQSKLISILSTFACLLFL
ncbi:hypothetical protein QEN19_000947 [Hanseniaspora menglaensis]